MQKPPEWEYVWHVQGTARKPVLLLWSKATQRKEETNIPHQYICKNPQQKTSKPNPTAYLKDYIPWLRSQECKSGSTLKKPINAIHHINKQRKKTNHLNWYGKKHLTIFTTLPWFKKMLEGTSLVAQWLRICLPMQGTWVQALVWKDPTCWRATKPVHHNYWACALEPASHNYWACEPQVLKPAHLEPMLCNMRSHRNEKPAHRSEE